MKQKKIKKIIKTVILVLFLILVLTVIGLEIFIDFMFTGGKTDSVEVQKGKDNFHYFYSERFDDGCRWYLSINGEYGYCYRLYPFEEYSHKEMKEHLANADLIKTILDEGNIRVYGLPLIQYESKYEIFYTVNDVDFYCWDKSDFYSEDDNEYAKKYKNRLIELYKYISEEELEKWSEESWE